MNKINIKTIILLSIIICSVVFTLCSNKSKQDIDEVVVEYQREQSKEQTRKNKEYLERQTSGYSRKSFVRTDNNGQKWVRMGVNENDPMVKWCNDNGIDLKNIEYLVDRKDNVIEIKLKNAYDIDFDSFLVWDKMESLSIQDSNLIDISGVEKLTTVRVLDLSKNNITDISPISNMEDLTHLNLSDNNIEDLSPLSKFTTLVHLNLDYNKIKTIDTIRGLWNIDTLFLDGNSISDISALSNMRYLVILRISENKVKDISPLSKLIGLRTLYLDGNLIEDVTPLFNLTNIKELLLYDNPINDVKYVRDLERMFDLKDIY
jgi:Leucine-rich repeat (LRR) protein